MVHEEQSGRYGTEHELQSYQVFETPPEVTAEAVNPKYWVIFVHGGAWRDPVVDASSFIPACEHLLASPVYDRVAKQIMGYASLNYRLSQHPEYPQDSSKVDPQKLNNAKYPDHLADVVRGISTLQTRYAFGSRYLLVGHSCGATMALQTLMQLGEVAQYQESWMPPVAVLGVDGIYDIPVLLETCANVPEYRASITQALGADEELWRRISPAYRDWLNGVNAWGADGRKLLVIAHSKTDELVDWNQAELMLNKLRSIWGHGEKGALDTNTSAEMKGCRRHRAGNFALLELHSTHHEVWESGWELARAIAFVIRGLNKLGSQQLPFADNGERSASDR